MALIGETVSSWRRQRGWTQEELAALADMKQNHISAIERGQLTDPQVSTVEKLARAFGVSVDELLAGVSEETASGEYEITQEYVALREMSEKWEALDDEQRQVVVAVFRQFARDNEARIVE